MLGFANRAGTTNTKNRFLVIRRRRTPRNDSVSSLALFQDQARGLTKPQLQAKSPRARSEIRCGALGYNGPAKRPSGCVNFAIVWHRSDDCNLRDTAIRSAPPRNAPAQRYSSPAGKTAAHARHFV